MLAFWRVIDHAAAALGKAPLDVRLANLYGPGREETQYGMTVADNIAPQMIARLRETSRYDERAKAVEAFNAKSPVIKKGIALTPVKFGIRSEEHTSELPSLMRISYAVFCLKKKNRATPHTI